MMNFWERLILQCFQCLALRKDYHCSVFNDDLLEKNDIAVFSMTKSSKGLTLPCFQWWSLRLILTLQCFQCWALRKYYHCNDFNDELLEKNDIAVLWMMNFWERVTLQCFQCWTLRKDYHYRVFNDDLIEKINIAVFSMMNSSKILTL